MIKLNKEDVISADLLSAEEAKKLPRWLLANGYWWWLRSSGTFGSTVANVGDAGYVDAGGSGVDYSDYGVRPALRIKDLDLRVIYDVSSTPRIEIGDIVEVFGLLAQYIGNDMILLCESIFNSRFDEQSNIYETSEVKQKLDEWFKRMKEG